MGKRYGGQKMESDGGDGDGWLWREGFTGRKGERDGYWSKFDPGIFIICKNGRSGLRWMLGWFLLWIWIKVT
jgi:hypothetical protein